MCGRRALIAPIRTPEPIRASAARFPPGHRFRSASGEKVRRDAKNEALGETRPRGFEPLTFGSVEDGRIMMLCHSHHDAKLGAMRTTVTLANDVAAAVERLRRERSIGVSEAVNELVRNGLAAPRRKRGF